MSKYTTSRRIRAISKLFQRGKTQVPSEVRAAMQLKDDDKLLWILDEGKWVVEKA